MAYVLTACLRQFVYVRTVQRTLGTCPHDVDISSHLTVQNPRAFIPAVKMEQDQICHLIGNFGKWQAFIIFPLSIHFMFGSFQTLVTSFLSLEGDFYCKIEAPEGIFDSLPQWRNFSNPVDVNNA